MQAPLRKASLSPIVGRLETPVPESVERYQRLVQRSPDGIFISQDTRMVFLNPSALRLVGASDPQEILGTAAP